MPESSRAASQMKSIDDLSSFSKHFGLPTGHVSLFLRFDINFRDSYYPKNGTIPAISTTNPKQQTLAFEGLG